MVIPMPHVTFPKPTKGSHWLAGRTRRAQRRSAEQKAMQAAKRRDERRCRVPRCEFMAKDMPIDAAHLIHRGMGGNPKLDRTTREQLISLCRWHHGQFDAGLLEIEPLTKQGTDGVCDYRAFDGETGRWLHVGTDRVTRVSVERSAS